MAEEHGRGHAVSRPKLDRAVFANLPPVRRVFDLSCDACEHRPRRRCVFVKVRSSVLGPGRGDRRVSTFLTPKTGLPPNNGGFGWLSSTALNVDHRYRGDRLDLPLDVVGRLQQALPRGLVRPLAIELQEEVERLQPLGVRLSEIEVLEPCDEIGR